MYELPETKKENPLAEKMAKQIFGIFSEYAKYKQEGAITDKTIGLIEREIDEVEKRQNAIITEETFSRVRALVGEEFSKKGGTDAVVSYILDLLSEVEKRRN